MKEEIENLITSALNTLGISETKFIVEHPADLKMGDYSTNVGIKTGKAKEILSYLEAQLPSGVEKVEIAGPGFINFFLSRDFFTRSLEMISENKNFGKGEHAKGLKVFVEHTQPNPFKEFHIGHLMNNALGEAIARIIRWNGAELKTASYHGDIGLHTAKAVWGIMRGMEYPYVAGSQAYEGDERAKKEIQEINKKIYDKSDPEINKIYESGKRESLEKFTMIYHSVGSEFDFTFFESEAGEVGRRIVAEHIGDVFEESEGAIVYRGEKMGLHTRVFLNSDGLPTYEAKELGLAKIKKDKFLFDLSITITASEQDAFFTVVEATIGEVFPELKGKLKHLSHGMLRLPSGKMSSRTGDVITAETLIEEVKKKTKGNEAVALGAIKYMILRQSIGSDIIFDLDKSVSTEGDSGVYLQYAYARASSIVEKAKGGLTQESNSSTHDIERLLYRFPEIVERAGREYAPNVITTYLTELASSFNNFYAQEEILGNKCRLLITKSFKVVMGNGLKILGIPAPERM
mgnify:FL=1